MKKVRLQIEIKNQPNHSFFLTLLAWYIVGGVVICLVALGTSK